MIKRTLFSVIAAIILLLPASMSALTPQQSVDNLKSRIAPDKRTALFQVTATDKVVSGRVGTQEQYDALVEALRADGFAKLPVKVMVLESQVVPAKRWALVTNSVATLRAEPKHSAEIETQAIMGMPLKVLEIDDEWCHVVCPDGYISWVPKSSVSFRTAEQLDAWKHAARYVITEYSTRLTTLPGGDETVSDLVLSNILELKGSADGDYLLLALPDGRQGYVSRDEVSEISIWARQDFNPDLLERVARRMMGSTYLWGGTSTKMTDCSGLMKVCYLANGIILQRDASQQALTGKKIKFEDWPKAERGDLVFFGNTKTGRVTHVGMYLNNGKVIHCSGRVKVNSLDPTHDDYLKGYGFLSLSRINGMIDTKGIAQVINHPWFF